MDAEAIAWLRRTVATEDDAMLTARARAAGSVAAPDPEVGTFLAWAATTVAARHVVEIGSAGGISGLWLLRGMETRGLLTSIEPDSHTQSLAASAFDDGGISDQVRSILGDPAEVLPRLSDDAYELVILQTAGRHYPDLLEHVLRLLKPGGMLVARGCLPAEGADAATARALTTFTEQLGENESLASAVLPISDGLAIATLR